MATQRILITAAIMGNFLMPRPGAAAIDSALNMLTPAALRAAVAPTLPAAANVPDAAWGGWVGPARITRVWDGGVEGTGGNVVTRIVRVYEYDDEAWPARTLGVPRSATDSLDFPGLLAALVNAYLVALIPVLSATIAVAATVATVAVGYGILTSVFGFWGALGTTIFLTEFADNLTTGKLLVPNHPGPYTPGANGPIEAWRDGRMARTATRDQPHSSLACNDELPDAPAGSRTPLCATGALNNALNSLARPAVDLLKWGAIFVGVAAVSYIGYRVAASWTTRRTYETTRRTRTLAAE